MIDVAQEVRGFITEQPTESVGPRDYLMLAGIYKQVHPELDLASQSIIDLRDTLNTLADPKDEKTGLIIARRLAFNRAVGASMLRLVDSPELGVQGTVIDEIFVEKRSRGHSVGRLLLEASIDFAHRNNSSYIQLGRLPQTLGSKRLFEALDFTEDSQGLLRLNLDK